MTVGISVDEGFVVRHAPDVAWIVALAVVVSFAVIIYRCRRGNIDGGDDHKW